MNDEELLELVETLRWDLLALPTNHSEDVTEIANKLEDLRDKLKIILKYSD